MRGRGNRNTLNVIGVRNAPQSLYAPEEQSQQQLLDVAELNAGASSVVAPGVAPGFIGNPVRLLDLNADSSKGRVVTVTFSQQLQTNQTFASYPIRGIVEFGNGGAFSTVEVDIPPPDPIGGYSISIFQAVIPDTFPKSGVSLSVPAGSLRVYARNDANAPFLFGPGVIGSGSNFASSQAKFVDPLVFAHVSYNSTFGSIPPTRTIYLINSFQDGANQIPPGGSTYSDIPPFSTGVRFSSGNVVGFMPGQTPAPSPGFRVTIVYDVLGQNSFTYDIAPGTDGHIEFGQTAAYLIITNTSGTTAINSLNAIFDIGNF